MGWSQPSSRGHGKADFTLSTTRRHFWEHRGQSPAPMGTVVASAMRPEQVPRGANQRGSCGYSRTWPSPMFRLNENPARAPHHHPRQLPVLAPSATPVRRCLSEVCWQNSLPTHMGAIAFAFPPPVLIVLILYINFISRIYVVTKLLDTVLYSQQEIICHSGENEHFLVLSAQRITLSGK